MIFLGVAGLLGLAIFLFAFFWTSSRVVRLHKGEPGECLSDSDCAHCCASSIPPLSACLEPLTNQSYKCVGTCCVVDAVPKEDFTVCDDGRYCTVGADYCLNGECVGVERDCYDADWCTKESCSEAERACVRTLDDDSSLCEGECLTSDECRPGYDCILGRCTRFREGNGTLFFLGQEMLPCPDTTSNWFFMRQHYAVIESSYQDDQGHFRYRVVDDASQIVLPVQDVDSSDEEGIALSHAQQHPQTRVVQSPQGAHTEITMTLNTECLHLSDEPGCLSMFANRRYSWIMRMRDCLADGPEWGECLPATFQRGASMELSVAQCPLSGSAYRVPVNILPTLRVEYADGAPLVGGAVAVGERVRAVLELPDEVIDHLDPFLVDVTVCSPKKAHRHYNCVVNAQQENCPYRGCRGWGEEENSPLVFAHHYMIDSAITARGVADNVVFCRGEPFLYNNGCQAGRCDWSDRNGQGVLGGGDGASFTVSDAALGESFIVDIRVRLEMCNEVQQTVTDPQYARHLGVIQIKKN